MNVFKIVKKATHAVTKTALNATKTSVGITAIPFDGGDMLREGTDGIIDGVEDFVKAFTDEDS